MFSSNARSVRFSVARLVSYVILCVHSWQLLQISAMDETDLMPFELRREIRTDQRLTTSNFRPFGHDKLN